MAILTRDELAELRQLATAQGAVANYTKAQINAAFQALEDLLEEATIKAAIAARIDTATAPLVLTAQQKKRLFARFIAQKARREGL